MEHFLFQDMKLLPRDIIRKQSVQKLVLATKRKKKNQFNPFVKTNLFFVS